MKSKLFLSFAFQGITKNKKVYFPYILTCTLMIMITYIMSFLSRSEEISQLTGGKNMQIIVALGVGVIANFATIFLIYTNSFLIRHRNKEFGLYNILGMNKKNISVIIVLENILVGIFSNVAGILLGILFSKLSQMIMVRMLGSDASYKFTINISSIFSTIAIYAIIFLIIIVISVLKVLLSKPIDLLHSTNHGEKPPKAKILLTILGLIFLISGYTLALITKSPSTAVFIFFIAVLFVIGGTYLLFISGSVSLCSLLKKNKRYYYKANHFISVSSMAYRMKRNGAGLASICILSTIILVMMSSVICLFIGKEDSLRNTFDRNISVSAYTSDTSKIEAIDSIIDDTLKEYNVSPENIRKYQTFSTGCYLNGNTFTAEKTSNSSGSNNLYYLSAITLNDYNKISGQQEKLGKDEILICDNSKINFTSINVLGLPEKSVRKCKYVSFGNAKALLSSMEPIDIVVNDINDLNTLLESYPKSDNWFTNINSLKYTFEFDLALNDETQIQIKNDIETKLNSLLSNDKTEYSVPCVADARKDFYSLYGGLLFLGIFLGIVFILATILIMYFKQITEGYEDQDKFIILQKVGMTLEEIKKSINSQILTVFFIPLLASGLHVAMAFNIIFILLKTFGLLNSSLLMLVTFLCFLLFACFYTIIYFITSKSYYKIVTAKQN